MKQRHSKRSERESMVTAIGLVLPPSNHPIWSMGTKQVAVAHSICELFFQLGSV